MDREVKQRKYTRKPRSKLYLRAQPKEVCCFSCFCVVKVCFVVLMYEHTWQIPLVGVHFWIRCRPDGFVVLFTYLNYHLFASFIN